MKRCVTCGKTITDVAAFCPGCGEPQRDTADDDDALTVPSRGSHGAIAGLLALLVAVAAIAGLGWSKFAREKEQRTVEAARVEAEAARVEAEAARVAAEAARLEAEKQAIRENPGLALDTREYSTYDRGLINDYTQLVSATITNRSKYALESLRGEAKWFDRKDNYLGSTAFTLVGSIAAGDTKTFSVASKTLTSATIAGKGTSVVLAFAPGSIVE
jgi:hypothetical protein